MDQIEKMTEVGADPDNLGAVSEAVFNKLEKGLPTFAVQRGGLWELWATVTELSQYRLNRYRDYDDMATDSLIASALELVTDDACQHSLDRGASIWPAKGSDEQWVKQALKTLRMEDNIWGWTHNTAMYGDFFPQIITRKAKGAKLGREFLSLDSSIHPREVRRLDIDGELKGFLTQEQFAKVRTHHPWEFVHFMLNNRPRFERHKLQVKGKGSDYTKTDEVPNRDGKGKVVVATSMYGTSWLDPARHVYRVLKLLEQSLALARLNRSPLIRVFYVNTTGLTPKQRKEAIDNLHKRFKKNLSMDMRGNFYKSDYNPLSFNADLFIPVTDQTGQITAETLGGELNIKDIVDIDYQRNKLFAALRTPKAYLGFEEALPGSIGSTTLVRLDIRYARSVKKIQRANLSGVGRILEVLYVLERGEIPDPKKIAVEMEVISGVEELDRMEALERKLGVAQQMIALTVEMEGKISPEPIYRYVFDSILGLKDMAKDLNIGSAPGTEADPETGEEGDIFSSMPRDIQASLVENLKEGKLPADLLKVMIEAAQKENIQKGATSSLAKDRDAIKSLAEKGAPEEGEEPEDPDHYDFISDLVRESAHEVEVDAQGEVVGSEEEGGDVMSEGDNLSSLVAEPPEPEGEEEK